MRNIVKKNWYVIGYSILLAAVYLAFTGPLKGIIFGDELGYWGTAAFFNGKDWSSVLSSLSYYSYGYSIWLTLLMKLGLSYEMLYKSSILLNVFCNLISFYLACNVGKKMFPKCSSLVTSSAAFMVSLYSGNIALAHCSWPETSLILLFWISLKLLLDILEKPATWRVSLFLVTVLYAFIMHQRALGVLCSGLLAVVLLLVGKKISIKQTVVPLLIFSVCYILHGNIKALVINHVFLNNGLISVNDFSGTATIMRQLFSETGLRNFVISIAGKVFYIAISTCFVGFCGIWALGKTFFNQSLSFIKKKDGESGAWFVSGYLIASFLSTLLIATLFLLEPPSRGYLFYGRYVEVILGPIILIGILYVLQNQNWKRVYIANTAVALTLCFLFRRSLQTITPNTGGVWTVGMSMFFTGQTKEFTVVFWALGVVEAVFLLILLLDRSRKNFLKKKKSLSVLSACMLFLILSGYWICAGNYVTYNWTIPKQNEADANLELIEEFVLQYDWKGMIAVDDELLPMALQFRLPDNKVVYADSEEAKHAEILYAKSISRDIQEDFEILSMPGSPFSVFISKDLAVNTAKFRYLIDLKTMSYGEDVPGYVAYGQYLTLPRGDYQVTFEVTGSSSQNNMGFCDVSAEVGTRVLQMVELKKDIFQEGKARLTIPFSLYKTTENIEFRLYANEGTDIKLTGLFYQQQKEHYTPGQENQEDAIRLTDKIKTDKKYQNVIYLNEGKEEISLSYMESLLPGYYVSVQGKQTIKSREPQSYIIANRDNTGWLELLGRYEIVESYEYYLLLSATEKADNDETEFADLNLLLKREDERYYYQHYDLQDAGEYEVELYLKDVPQTDICVEIFNGRRLLDAVKVNNGKNTVQVTVSSLDEIRDLNFHIYSQTEKSIYDYSGGKIRKQRDGITYVGDTALKPLLDIADELYGDRNVIMVSSTWNELFKKQLEEYLAGYANRTEFVEYNNIEQQIPNENWMILPFGAKEVFFFLDKYTVAEKTSKYVLLVKTEKAEEIELAGGHRLSNENWLDIRFFEQDMADRIYRSTINLLAGTYELYLDVEYQDQLLSEDDCAWLEVSGDGRNLGKSLLQKDMTTLEISSGTDIANLTTKVLEQVPGTVQCRLAGIRRVSDAYKIDLSNMRFFSSSYNEDTRVITGVGDIIYGPYMTLKKGQYNIIFRYTSSVAKEVNFDVTANAGEILCNPEDADITQEGDDYIATLQLELREDAKQVEFRTHIPADISCTLKSITIKPINRLTTE